MNRILGIDFGTKRFGLAFGDFDSGVVTPLDTLELNGRDGVEVISAFVVNEGFDAIVIGVPFGSDGSHTPGSDRVMSFASKLRRVLGLPVYFVNEFLTSSASDLISEEIGGRLHDDSLAAKLILDEYFNTLRQESFGDGEDV